VFNGVMIMNRMDDVTNVAYTPRYGGLFLSRIVTISLTSVFKYP
jgi:hypothetical protein